MKRKMISLAGIVTLFLLSFMNKGFSREPTDYLALVVELKGEVTVQRKAGKEFVPVVWGNYIYQGDLVRAGKESQVSLLFANGTMIELSANSQMVIKRHPGVNPDEVTTEENHKEKVVPELSRLQIKSYPFQKPELQIASDGSHRLIPTLRTSDTDTILVSPRMTTISSRILQFKWKTPAPDVEYKISLSNAESVLWSTGTRQNEIECPLTLNRGESYLWTLSIYQGLRRIQGPFSTQFKVMDRQEYQEFSLLLKKMQNLDANRRSKNYYHFIIGFTYLKYDLIEKAIPHFRILAAENPGAAFPHEALCRLYLDQQMPEEAQKHYRQWRALLTAESQKINEVKNSPENSESQDALD